MKKIDRLNEIACNVDGLEMKIIEYVNNKKMKVLFTASGIVRETTYMKFKQGRVYPTWRNMKSAQYNEVDLDEECENECGKAVVCAVGFVTSLLALALGGAITYGIIELIKCIF